MPLRRNRRQYEQLTDFDRGRIIGLREAAWGYPKQPSSRNSSCEVGRRGRKVGGPRPPQGVFPQNWGGNKPNRSVTCTMLKAKANDTCH
ncbi:hypothetical protein TNCV_2109361 [Trichonephila clavipes]|nr:hypothetical protein TNCV_2109361 [Trichonephila clavipes]